MADPVATDFSAFAPLRAQARANDPQALRAAAHQFEALFTQMLLKSMRAATPSDDLMSSEQGDFYRDLFDQQLSLSLASGKGLGLADMLVKQLSPAAAPAGPAAPAQAVSSPVPAKAEAQGPPAPALDARVRGHDAVPDDHRQRYIEAVLPHAQQAARALGVDPAAVLAQSALESNWGRSVPAAGNNLFGMKARAGEPALTSVTTEFERGVAHAQPAAFRAYASVAESFADYAHRIGTAARYAGARNAGTDVARFARGLQDGGYATDPAYARKLDALASDPAFRARVRQAARRLGIGL